MNSQTRNIIRKEQKGFSPVVLFDPKKDKLVALDFTEKNKELTSEIFEDTDMFSEYINLQLQSAKARYGIGGYGEHRKVYGRSTIFDSAKTDDEPRRVHLGIDIWGSAGTPVFAPLGGMIHSFAFNRHYGDYGATMIILHQLDDRAFYTLYGHISLNDIDHLKAGEYVIRGEEIAHFGESHENGHWPPHLHFQIIIDMELYEGDYPGVCRNSEKEKYLANCPDPDLILQMNQYL